MSEEVKKQKTVETKKESPKTDSNTEKAAVKKVAPRQGSKPAAAKDARKQAAPAQAKKEGGLEEVKQSFTGSKVKKKFWFPIHAPKVFNSVLVGETTAFDAAGVVGKRLKTNLMSLTNDIKKQNISVELEVSKVLNNKAVTFMRGYDIVKSSVKRLVRRRSEKIDMSFLCKTKDGEQVRIKPLITTRSKANNSALTEIRKIARTYIKQQVGKGSLEDLMRNLVDKRYQYALRKYLNKVHPTKIVEIRSASLISGK